MRTKGPRAFPVTPHKRKRLTSRSSRAPKAPKRNCDLDLDILECPICTDFFSLPVYQCQNGHPACARCCKRLTKGCPSCQLPIGTIRCITIEKLVESMLVACKNAPHGCQKMLKCGDRAEHEENCEHVTDVQCPVRECFHDGTKFTLPVHLKEEHEVRMVELNAISRQVGFRMEAPDRLVLVKGVKEEMYLVHREIKEDCGETFFCTSFGVRDMSYDLKVRLLYTSAKSYSVADIVTDIRMVETCRDEDFLLYPFYEPDTNNGFDILIGIFPPVDQPPESSEEEDSD